jgi:ankyrin repeat protein
MVKLLVKTGANVNIAGVSGHTPLTKSVEMENFRLVKYLVEREANINLFDGNRNCALSIAARMNYFRIAKFLIDSGADVNLARQEIEEYASWNNDFALCLKASSFHQLNR